MEKTAFALRPKVHSPKDIVRLANLLDEYVNVTNVFIPDIPAGFESLDIASAALSNSKRLFIGSGVIRILEHEDRLLLRRLETIQAISQNRLVLGVGTGDPGRDPRATIEALISKLNTIRDHFSNESVIRAPETFIATLKHGIAKQAAGSSNGILLNFCSPSYAKSLIERYRQAFGGKTEFACYLKVFYSEKKEVADLLLMDEFYKYNKIPQYHKMFVRDGVSDVIESEGRKLQSGEKIIIPRPLFDISLANPSNEEIREYIARFRAAGVTLPCVYPYFSSDENFEYRSRVVRAIAESL